MIVGLGTDIVETERIAEAYQKFGEKILQKVYSPEEVEYAFLHSDPIPYLGARFAVKEAAIKALNLKGVQGLSFRDIRVTGQQFGKKKVVFDGRIKEIATDMQITKIHMSLSHTSLVCMAVVILESES